MYENLVLPYLAEIENLVASKGNFTYRCNNYLAIRVPDDTIFTQAASVYILDSIYSYLSHEEKGLVDGIKSKIIPNYTLFENRNGRLSYNFWQTSNSKSHFPNGKILHRFKYFRLPDDVDTTAMVALTTSLNDEEKLALKNSLPFYANNYKLTVQNSLPAFQNLKCYSTWFGKNMPIELDCCVLSNLLLWIFEFGLPLNENDRDVIEFLSEIILGGYIHSHTFQIAPEYPKKAIIYYHLARLIAKYPSFFQDEVVATLKRDIEEEYRVEKNKFSKMLLQTSLLRFGSLKSTEIIGVDAHKMEQYWWFTAGFLSVFSSPLLKIMAPNAFFHQRFVSQSLNNCLLIENRLLLRGFHLKNSANLTSN